MDGDRPVVDGRHLLESELQDLIRKVWNEARKYGDALYYARVDKEVFLRGYDCDIHNILVSYLDSPTSDVAPQDETPEEGAMEDGVRSKAYIDSDESFRYTFKEFDPIPDGYLRQLMTKKPYKFEISKDGKAVFKIWNLPQNLK